MPIEPDLQDDEPTQDDLDFYYGLNRRSAQKQDAPFANWGVLAFIGILLVIPIGVPLMFLSGNGLGIIVSILFVLIIIVFPILWLVIALMSSIVFSSVLESLRQIFSSKDR